MRQERVRETDDYVLWPTTKLSALLYRHRQPQLMRVSSSKTLLQLARHPVALYSEIMCTRVQLYMNSSTASLRCARLTVQMFELTTWVSEEVSLLPFSLAFGTCQVQLKYLTCLKHIQTMTCPCYSIKLQTLEQRKQFSLL